MKEKGKNERSIEFGKYLKTLREKQNLTQGEAAEKAHVSLKDLEIWEKELDYPSLRDIYNLADVYWVTCEEMLKKREKSIKSKSKLAIIFSKIVRIYINGAYKIVACNISCFCNCSIYVISITCALKKSKKACKNHLLNIK